MLALIYLFPNMDTIGGFWLVFGAGTALAAWVNFGTPRLSYAGYQTGLAFYKTTLHDFGPSVNLTVFRDRMVGVALGLAVFGLVEHVLWPLRAADRMRERMADVLRSLANLARACAEGEGAAMTDLDEQRRLISQQVADVQGFIECSKFEPGDDGPGEIGRLVGDAQTVFLVLLAIARQKEEQSGFPRSVQESMMRLDMDAAAVLDAVAQRVKGGGPPPIRFDEALAEVETSTSTYRDPCRDVDESYRGMLSLYRELASAVERLSSLEYPPC
jgi:multidrug resistance protein MdtO